MAPFHTLRLQSREQLATRPEPGHSASPVISSPCACVHSQHPHTPLHAHLGSLSTQHMLTYD